MWERCEDAPCCGCGGPCGTPLGGAPDYGYEDAPDPDDFYEEWDEDDSEEWDDEPDDSHIDAAMESALMGEM